MRPRCMTTTCSARSAARPRSWVTKSIAVPNSWMRRPRWSRMRRWTVTSRALVGSSAMSSRGRAARPMAIRARCRIPPENSCGYCLARRAASGSPASSSRSATCSAVAIRLCPCSLDPPDPPEEAPSETSESSGASCPAASLARRSSATPASPLARSASRTWKPMDHTGLRLVMGSWGTNPISLPRRRCICLSEACAMSSPSNRMRPPVTRPVPGSRPMTALARVVFPEPDSPTMATLCPG